MRYVAEMEVAQNNFGLGFPSIQGCNAIIYATRQGLFGFHSFGGGTKERWDERAALFATFVANAAGGAVQGSRLYSVTYRDRRGYSSPAQWREELVAYADALNFGGKLRGVDLSRGPLRDAGSAYVRARRAGDKCEIFCKAWNDAHRRATAVPNPVLHRKIARRVIGGQYQVSLEAITGQVLTDFDEAGTTRLHSERLRGL